MLFDNPKLNSLEFIHETEVLSNRGYRSLMQILHEINYELSDSDRKSIDRLYKLFDENVEATKPYWDEIEKQHEESRKRDHEKEYKIYDFDCLDMLRAKKESIEVDYEAKAKQLRWELFKAQNRLKDAQLVISYSNDLSVLSVHDDPEYRKICHYLKVCEANLGMNKEDSIDIDGAKHISITQLFEINGIKVKKGFCNCPFHGEDTPSCKVYDKSQSFYCFGCGVGGSTIDFVIKYMNMEFPDAVKYLNSL